MKSVAILDVDSVDHWKVQPIDMDVSTISVNGEHLCHQFLNILYLSNSEFIKTIQNNRIKALTLVSKTYFLSGNKTGPGPTNGN